MKREEERKYEREKSEKMRKREALYLYNTAMK